MPLSFATNSRTMAYLSTTIATITTLLPTTAPLGLMMMMMEMTTMASVRRTISLLAIVAWFVVLRAHSDIGVGSSGIGKCGRKGRKREGNAKIKREGTLKVKIKIKEVGERMSGEEAKAKVKEKGKETRGQVRGQESEEQERMETKTRSNRSRRRWRRRDIASKG